MFNSKIQVDSILIATTFIMTLVFGASCKTRSELPETPAKTKDVSSVDEITAALRKKFENGNKDPQRSELRIDNSDGWKCYSRSAKKGDNSYGQVVLKTKSVLDILLTLNLQAAGAADAETVSLTKTEKGWIGRTTQSFSEGYSEGGNLNFTTTVTSNKAVCLRQGTDGNVLLEVAENHTVTGSGYFFGGAFSEELYLTMGDYWNGRILPSTPKTNAALRFHQGGGDSPLCGGVGYVVVSYAGCE